MPSEQNNEMIQIPKSKINEIENRLKNLEATIKKQENDWKKAYNIIYGNMRLHHSFFIELFLKAYDGERVINEYIKNLTNPEKQKCMKQLWKMFHKNPTPPINTPPQA